MKIRTRLFLTLFLVLSFLSLIGSPLSLVDGNAAAHPIRVHHEYPANGIRFSRHLKRDQFQAVNRIRHRFGRRQLKSSNKLSRLAYVRAVQASIRFTHYSHAGHNYSWQLSSRLGLYPSLTVAHRELSENLAYNVRRLTHHRRHFARHEHSIIVGRPYRIAKYDNAMMTYWDSGSNWTHRENILSRYNRYLGVSVYYDPAQRIYYTAFEFAHDRPR